MLEGDQGHRRTLTGRPCREITVAVFDDEPAFRTGMVGALGDDGHPVLEFGEPNVVPPLTVLDDIAVLITGYPVRGAWGMRIVDAFHRAQPTRPVLIVTAYQHALLQYQADARSWVRLSEKPFDYDELHQLVHGMAG